MMFLAATRYHLKNLANFSGRETRAQFWPYAGFVVALMIIGMMAVMLPAMADSMEKVQTFAKDHPDLTTVQSGPGSYSISIQGSHPELMPDMGSIDIGIAIASFLVIFLLAAAVARRLHDRGKSGAWGLMPLPFLAFAFTMMPKIFAQTEFDMALFFTLFINNMIYIGTLIALVVLLAGASNTSDNQYGPAPNGS